MGSSVFFAILAAMLASPAGWSQTSSASAGSDIPPVRQLLSNVKNLVPLLKSDIATLDLLVRPAGGAQAVLFNLYTEHIANLRSQADKLEALRKSGTRWQQVAIDRMVPAMQELAASAEAAINWTRSNQDRLSSTDYGDYLKLNADLAEELSRLITSCVDYAKTREDLERASANIGAPSASKSIFPRRPDAEQQRGGELRARVFEPSATQRGAGR